MRKFKSSVRIIRVSLLLLLVLTVVACEDTSDDSTTLGNWVKTTPFLGAPRSGAVQFTIEDRVYVGLGYNPNSSNSEYVQDGYFKDFYMYDSENGYWTRVASFPGDLRERAVSFSIEGKGYIGLGYNRKLAETELKDFWQYNPELDEWTKRSTDFIGSARYNAIGFAIGSVGYVGTGFDNAGNYNSDFYKYEPGADGTDTWTQLPSFKGDKRERAFSFVINGIAYVGGGTSNDLFSTDFYQFDPETNTWTSLEISDEDDSYYDEFVAAVARYDAVAFVLNDRAYISNGIGSSGSVVSSVYEFDPSNQSWDEMSAFEGSLRSLAVSFVVGGRAYVGTGQYSSSRYDDIWEFRPNEELDEDD